MPGSSPARSARHWVRRSRRPPCRRAVVRAWVAAASPAAAVVAEVAVAAERPARRGLFGWFESRLDPFPEAPPRQPPRGLVAFCLHYTRGAGGWLLLMGVLGALIAAAELGLYVYLGAIVDTLGEHTPATFLEAEGRRLLWMALLVAVGLPLLVLLDNLVQMQVLLGNFPMRIR